MLFKKKHLMRNFKLEYCSRLGNNYSVHMDEKAGRKKRSVGSGKESAHYECTADDVNFILTSRGSMLESRNAVICCRNVVNSIPFMEIIIIFAMPKLFRVTQFQKIWFSLYEPSKFKKPLYETLSLGLVARTRNCHILWQK